MIKRNLIFIVLLAAISSFIFINQPNSINAGVKEDCQNTYKQCVKDCSAKSSKNLKFDLKKCKEDCEKTYKDCLKKSIGKKFGF